jgi:hypothetical protein
MNFLTSRFVFKPTGGISLRLQGPDDVRERRLDISGRILIENVSQADQIDIMVARLLFSEQTSLVGAATPRGKRIAFQRQDIHLSVFGKEMEELDEADFVLEAAEIKVKKLAPADGEEAQAYIHVTLTADAEKLGHREFGLLWEQLDNDWTMIARESAFQGAPEKSDEQREQERLEKAGQQRLIDATVVTFKVPGKEPVVLSKKAKQMLLQGA